MSWGVRPLRYLLPSRIVFVSAPSPLSPVRTTAARRVAVAAALGLGSAYAVAIVGYGFPLGLALADLFRDTRTPAPALWLERIAGPGMGPIWVCRAVALLLAVAALVAVAGLWRQAPWAKRALRAWQIAGGLAAAVALLLYLPPHPEHVLQVVLPWVLYVATVSYVATPAGPGQGRRAAQGPVPDGTV